MEEKSLVFKLSLTTAFAFGIVLASFPVEPAKPAFGFIVLYLLVWRVFIDAAEYNFKRSKLFNICLILFACLTLPYYLFKTRGFIKATISIFRILIFLLLALVVLILGAFLTMIVQELSPMVS